MKFLLYTLGHFCFLQAPLQRPEGDEVLQVLDQLWSELTGRSPLLLTRQDACDQLLKGFQGPDACAYVKLFFEERIVQMGIFPKFDRSLVAFGFDPDNRLLLHISDQFSVPVCATVPVNFTSWSIPVALKFLQEQGLAELDLSEDAIREQIAENAQFQNFGNIILESHIRLGAVLYNDPMKEDNVFIELLLVLPDGSEVGNIDRRLDVLERYRMALCTFVLSERRGCVWKKLNSCDLGAC